VIRLLRRKPQPSKVAVHVEVPVLHGEAEEAELTAAIDESKSAVALGTAVEAPSEERGTPAATAPTLRSKGPVWRRALVFGLLPGLAMVLAGGVAYIKWQKTTLGETQTARIESVQAAMDSTIKILSYDPDTVDRDLEAARDRLTGTFRDAYTQLIHDVVIPGAKQKKISAVATVPAAALVSASPGHAVVMVYVNQAIVMGNDPPSSTASTVRVTMDKSDNRWLISDFTPI